MTDKLDERPESVQKCPFCGEELSYAQEIDGGFEILTCDCPYGIWFFGNDKMWNFLDWLLVQEDKAERLEKENEAMREEFEVWHGNYKCEIEEKKQLQKDLEIARKALESIIHYQQMVLHMDEIATNALEQIDHIADVSKMVGQN